MQPGGYTQDLGPIRDSNVVATLERPWKVLIHRRHQPCCPFREHRQDTVSALAGARQVVLSDHEEYLVIQTLQFLSPHFRVANLQSTESRHLRGSLCSPGLFIQRPKGLKSAFMFLEGERNRRTGIPPPRLERRRFFEQLLAVAGSLVSLCHSDRRSLQHLPYPGWRLGHLRQRRPFFVVGTLLGVVRPLPVGDLER